MLPIWGDGGAYKHMYMDVSAEKVTQVHYMSAMKIYEDIEDDMTCLFLRRRPTFMTSFVFYEGF